MLLTLIKALNTTDLVEVVSQISLAPIDVDLMLRRAEKNGDIEIDREKGKIKALKEPDELYYNPKLAESIKETVQHYDENEANVTYSRLEMIVLNLYHPHQANAYPCHDFVCTMYWLEESGAFNFYEISVPEIKDKRPFNKFKFYTYLDHQEYGAKVVNDFIDQFEKKDVK